MVTLFQSTAPVWGPTVADVLDVLELYISIHGPRVGADRLGLTFKTEISISIHGPRVGADAECAEVCFLPD